MPSATTKATMAGTKRKAESTKEAHQKKPKISLPIVEKKSKKEKKPSKAIDEEKPKKEKKPSKAIIEEKPKKEKKSSKAVIEEKPNADDDVSSEDELDGGVELYEEEDVDMEDEDVEEQEEEDEGPAVADGVHPDRIKKVEAENTNSREAHAKQKQLIAERKAAKPLADLLARAKKLWERLRRKSHVPLEERKVLVAELFEIITGNVKDFVLKHDSGRVIQTAIKYANLEQKKMIANELKGTYRQLAESKYAKFLIGKLLVEGDEEIRDLIIPEFFGHVRKMIKHPEASWILDDVYRGIATKQQKATILREWYGAEFSVFQDSKVQVSGDLSTILEENPGKRSPIMRSLQELINQLLQKKFTAFTLLHDAMLQYFLNAKPDTEEMTDFMTLLIGEEEGDLLKNLAFTKSGARVVCFAFAYATAKDRRQLLKQYKDTFHIMAGDVNAHIVILTAYEVIDDTKSTAKSIFPDLLGKDEAKQVENIVNSANNAFARTTLLYLLEGRSKPLFLTLKSDLDVLKEIDSIRSRETTTSKKNPETRRAELATALSPSLIKGVEAAAAELAQTPFGCHFLTEVVFGAEGDKSAALTAIAATASGDPSVFPDVETNTPGHLANTPPYPKLLKSLILGGPYSHAEKKIVPVVPALNFADTLYPIIKEEIVAWATGSSSFVVLALLETEAFGSKDELKKTLLKHKKELVKASKEETVIQKLQRETPDEKLSAKGKKKKASADKAVGNVGSRLILEKL